MINDINNKNLYLVLNNENKIAGVCALTYHENDYDHLYEGKRITDLPYMVMHRIAVKKEYLKEGYGKQLFQLFIDVAKSKGYKSIRVDTHENNTRMRNILKYFGFVNCGKAILTPNKDRIVYEKLL